jgi:DNA-binding CsgD family transcriptional regulator
MTSQTKIKKLAKKFQIEERRRQVALMIAQSMTEVEIAEKLGVDNSTISKDIKALKLISQQFIYDITKSDFTYYYKQCLEMVKLILRKQWEIVDKEQITKEDMDKAKILVDIMNTVNTINGYYNAAPALHRSPLQKVFDNDNFGIRPGSRTRIYKMTPEEEEAEFKAWEEEDAKALEEEHSSSFSSPSSSSSELIDRFRSQAKF